MALLSLKSKLWFFTTSSAMYQATMRAISVDNCQVLIVE